MTQPSALTAIAICQIITTVSVFAAAGALVYGFFSFKKMISAKMDEMMAKVQPVVDNAQAIAEQAKETAENVSKKVDSMVAKAEETAGRVSDKVDSISEKVEGAVNPQVVTIAGLVGTAARVVQIYTDLKRARRCASAADEPAEGVDG